MDNKPTGFLAMMVAAREVRTKDVRRKCLLLYYAANTVKNGSFFKSLLDISLDTAISESTIQRINADWKKNGVLSWEEGNVSNGTANTYRLNLTTLQKTIQPSRKMVEAKEKERKGKAAERAKRYRDNLKKHPKANKTMADLLNVGS